MCQIKYIPDLGRNIENLLTLKFDFIDYKTGKLSQNDQVQL